VDSQGLFPERPFKKKPDVDSKPFVVKANAKAKESMQRQEKLGLRYLTCPSPSS
jgi:hypothetical protein